MNNGRPGGYEPIYRALSEGGTPLGDGMAYVLLANNRLVELCIRRYVIIAIRARGLDMADVMRRIGSGDIINVRVSPAQFGFDAASPDIIAGTFTDAAACIFGNGRSTPNTLVSLLRLISHLAAGRQAGHDRTAEIIISVIQASFPDFVNSRRMLQHRIAGFERNFDMPLPFLNLEGVPAEGLRIIEWAVGRIASNDPEMEDFILYNLFWGKQAADIRRGVVKRGSAGETEPGIISIPPPPGAQPAAISSSTLFRGMNRIGHFRVRWLKRRQFFLPEAGLAAAMDEGSQRNSGSFTLLMSAHDIDRCGLREGDTVFALIH